jgi:hypothetical protein
MAGENRFSKSLKSLGVGIALDLAIPFAPFLLSKPRSGDPIFHVL